MSGEVGFSLPDSHIYRMLGISLFLIGTVAWMITIMLGHISLNAQLSVAVAMVPVAFLVYLGMKHEKLVYLSPDGVKGKSRFGFKKFFPWSRHVLITVDENRELKSLCVNAADKDEYLLVPIVIARTGDFIRQLREFAPAGHPLVAEVEGLQLIPTSRRRPPTRIDVLDRKG